MKKIRILLISLLLISSTLFANNVATITAVKGSATITRDSSNIDAKLGSKLQESDIIKTHENTKVQLIFTDETIISLGKNSNFSIKEFLFEDNQEPIAKFGMINGAIRVITGKIGKIAPERFSVSTKTATIGIRGTNFTIIANENNSYQVYCTYGKISVTYNNKTYIVQQGYFIDISSSGEVIIKEFNPEILKKMRFANFGVLKHKSNKVSKNGKHIYADGGDEESLDVTVEDNSGLIVLNIIGDSTDGIQRNYQDEISLTLSELLASYTMKNASYSGTSFFDSDDPGTATLDIDFGADTASLSIIDSNELETIFETNPTFGSINFRVDQTTVNGSSNDGVANGTFQEPKGNQVLGDFSIDDGYGNFSTGTYDVSSTQTLH